ncbi:hypothetical protein MHBO_000114 [Bonamia ostreae]|uniref:Uncharacterized protein n=1 Tax=Bonamia ostreae TaxID=126728 RepID=A0ABV2AEE8_9EUKA
MQKLVRFLNSPWRFFRDVKKVYGGKYLVYQFCAYCLVIGFLFKSTRFNVYPYMKKHGSTSNEIQFYSMIMKVPFNLQPAIGLLADIYPLFGYYKRFYVLIASLLGTLALLVLSFVNLGKTMLVFPFLMLFNFAHIATVLLLSNTKYIQIANSVPNFKRHMVSLAMGLRFTGSLAGNYVGYFVTKHDPINVFRIGSVFSFSIILPVLLGFIPEEKVSNPKIEREKLSKVLFSPAEKSNVFARDDNGRLDDRADSDLLVREHSGSGSVQRRGRHCALRGDLQADRPRHGEDLRVRLHPKRDSRGLFLRQERLAAGKRPVLLRGAQLFDKLSVHDEPVRG